MASVFLIPLAIVGSLTRGAQLFNATAIKEAFESSRQNQYILVFTIVTVIYLPFSVVTVSAVRLGRSSNHFQETALLT